MRFQLVLVLLVSISSGSYANIPGPVPDECHEQKKDLGSACVDADGNKGECQKDRYGWLQCMTPKNIQRFGSCRSVGTSSSLLLTMLSLVIGASVLVRQRRRNG